MIDLMIPFYGDPDLLRAAVQSVLAQSSSQWRLVVVDDCYPDSAPGKWVADLDDPRVSYQRNEERLGVSGNFRRCLELATAPFVTFVGCDDLLSPDYVAVVCESFDARPSVSAVHPGVRVIDERGRSAVTVTDRVKSALMPRGGRTRTLAGEAFAVNLLHGNWTYFPSICWKREFVEAHAFREDMETVLDFDLLMDLVLDDRELLLVPELLFAYRRHRHSASSSTARTAARFEEESRLFEEAARRCQDRGWPRAARAARSHVTSRLHAALLVPSALRRHERETARQLVRHVVQRPVH